MPQTNPPPANSFNRRPPPPLNFFLDLRMKIDYIICGPFSLLTFYVKDFCLQGGFKAVIWADVFQSIIIVIGIFAILIQVSPRRDSVLLYILCSANKLKQ